MRSGLFAMLAVLVCFGHLAADEEDDRILAALEKKTSLELLDTRLVEFAKVLSDRIDANVIIDRQALDDDAIPLDTSLSGNFTNVQFKVAIRLVLDRYGLTYTVENGVMKITTQTSSEEHGLVRIHSVPKALHSQPSIALIRAARPPNNFAADNSGPITNSASTLSGVLHIIQRTIQPDVWAEHGGVGEIRAFGNQLIISAPLDVHEEVTTLIKNMARAEQEDGVEPIRTLEATREALKKRVDLEVVDATLAEVAVYCTDLGGVPFVVDERALEEDGIPIDTTISCSLSNLSLGHALRLALDEHQLTWILAGQLVKITTLTEAANLQATAYYPVGDLTAGHAFGVNQLIRTLQNTISNDDWAVAGGNGQIEVSPSNRTLVISTTEAIHERVGKLLANLRTGWDPRALEQQRNHVVAVVYAIQSETSSVDDVLEFLRGENSGVEWSEETDARIVGDELLVRHRAEEQLKIRELIEIFQDPQGVEENPFAGGGGSGGGGFGGGGGGGGGFFSVPTDK